MEWLSLFGLAIAAFFYYRLRIEGTLVYSFAESKQIVEEIAAYVVKVRKPIDWDNDDDTFRTNRSTLNGYEFRKFLAGRLQEYSISRIKLFDLKDAVKAAVRDEEFQDITWLMSDIDQGFRLVSEEYDRQSKRWVH